MKKAGTTSSLYPEILVTQESNDTKRLTQGPEPFCGEGKETIRYAIWPYTLDSNMIWECRNKINEEGKKNKVLSIWVPGHSGIKGNEEANRLAKESARMSLIGTELFCGIGKCTYKKEFLEKEKAEREELWRNLPGMDHFTMFPRDFETAIFRRYLDFSKKQLHLLAGFLTGHCRLRKHLLRMGLSETYKCS